MSYSDMGIPAEELLEKIFTKTQNLYKEIFHSESDASSNHYEIFRLLTDLGRILINADRASFWKWNKRAHEIWTTAAVGTGRITIPEGTGIVGKAISEKRVIIVNDPYNDLDFNSDVDIKFAGNQLFRNKALFKYCIRRLSGRYMDMQIL